MCELFLDAHTHKYTHTYIDYIFAWYRIVRHPGDGIKDRVSGRTYGFNGGVTVKQNLGSGMQTNLGKGELGLLLVNV